MAFKNITYKRTGELSEAEFIDELKKINLWNKATVDAINKTRGNVDLIPKLPAHLKEKYRNNVITINQRPIRSDESVYLYSATIDH